MAEASIPIDLFNPGQVFACLGFLEAADVLLGDAEGGFDWSAPGSTRFLLRAAGEVNPMKTVLSFLAGAVVVELEPTGWQGMTRPGSFLAETFPSHLREHFDNQEKKWTRTRFPIRLSSGSSGVQNVELCNWSDGSSRPLFKLYSGNRSASGISRDMLHGKRAKPTKTCPAGKIENQGVSQLLEARDCEIISDPFNQTCSLGGRFNFDARGAWTALDAGFSPDRQQKVSNIGGVAASPVVEFLAAWGVENARPKEIGIRRMRYGVWAEMLPPMLARPALAAISIGVRLRAFVFSLELSGKNKVVTHSTEESM
jgi:CRISPR-associated protein Csx14